MCSGGLIRLGLAGKEQSSEEEQSASSEITVVPVQLGAALRVVKASSNELKVYEVYAHKLG